MKKKELQKFWTTLTPMSVAVLTLVCLGAADSRTRSPAQKGAPIILDSQQKQDPANPQDLRVIPDSDAAAQVKTYQVIYATKSPGQSQHDLSIITETGTNRRAIANSSYDEWFCIAEYTASSLQRVVFGRDENGVYKYYSVLSTGSSRVYLDLDIAEFIGIVGASPGRLIYTKPGSNGYDLFSIKLTGSPKIKLSSDLPFPNAELIGDRIIYAHRPAGQSDSDIRTIKADGSESRVIADAGEQEEPVGQLGQRVIFFRYVNGQSWLYAAMADGSDDRPTRLSQFDADCRFQAASGERVVYEYGQPNSRNDLVSVSISGSDTRVAETYIDSFRGFSGSRIVYEKTISDKQIFAVDHTGLNRAQLTDSEFIEYVGILQDRIIYMKYGQGYWDLLSNNSYGTDLGQIRLGMQLREKFYLDKTSGRVVLKLFNGSNSMDLYSCLPSGGDWKPLSESVYEDEFRCSSPNRFFFVRKNMDGGDLNLYSATYSGTDRRALGNSSSLIEDILVRYDKWLPVIEYRQPSSR